MTESVPRRTNRTIWLFFLLVIIGLVAAAVAGGGMVNDGSYYFIRALKQGFPFIPNRRMIHDPTQRPLLFAAQFISDLGVLQSVFSLAYALIPLLSLVAAWYVVRKDDRSLFLWAALGILIAPLPVQFAYIAESAHSVQFFVPVALAFLVPLRWRNVPIIVIFGVASFFTNPVSILLFGGLAIMAFIAALHYHEQRRGRLIVAGIITAVAIIGAIRLAVQINPYESEQLSLDLFRDRFFSSFFGVTLLAMILAYLGGLVLLNLPGTERFKLARRILAAALLVGMGTAFFVRVAVPSFWADTLNFRFFVQFTVAPFMLFALIDSLIRNSGRVAPQPGDEWPYRLRLLQTVGLTFAVSLLVQSIWWVNYADRLRSAMANSQSACLSLSDPQFSWIGTTPLDHWTITGYSLLLQGRTPQKIILKDMPCTPESFAKGVPIEFNFPYPWDAQTPFDLSQLKPSLLGK